MTIPVGMCQCGCGKETTVARQNHAARGWVKGQPIRFVPGHRIMNVRSDEERRAIRNADARRWYENRKNDLKTLEWREKRNEYLRAYHKSKSKEQKDKINAWRRERYRQKGPDPKPEGYKEWLREYTRKWNRQNRELRISYTQNRRAKIRGNGGSYTVKEWRELVEKHDHRCAHCRKQEPEIKLTVDHIIPVVRGGRNTIDNIQPLCGPCNSSKGVKEVAYAA